MIARSHHGVGFSDKDVRCHVLLRRSQFSHALRGLSYVVVWGRVDYEDIFGGTHYTYWCKRMNFTRDARGVSAEFITVGDYNGSDEDSRTS